MCHFAPKHHAPFSVRDYVWIKWILSTICVVLLSTKMVWIHEKELNNCIQPHSVVLRHICFTSQWRHSVRGGVSNHQPYDCLLNGLFRCRSKKISKLRVTGLYVGNSPVTGGVPAQMASNAEMFPFDDVIIITAVNVHNSNVPFCPRKCNFTPNVPCSL